MFRQIRSRTAAAPGHRGRRAGHVLAGVALCILPGLAIAARAASYDSLGQFGAGGSGDGLASVIVGEPGMTESATAGRGWTVTDGGGESELMSDNPSDWPEDRCRDGSCPPWNGVPGIINNHLGDACPRLVFAVDALMLWQGNVPSRPLFVDRETDRSLLNVNQINAPVSVGPRLDLIVNVNQCNGIEANWFNVQTFAGARELPQGASQYSMNNLAGMRFADIDTAYVTTAAAFKSFELNWRRRNATAFTWLAGFRWVEWNQRLDILDTYTDELGASGTDAATVVTGNNLYGGQIGVDALLWNTGNWVTFNGVAKAGVFWNDQAYQRTALLGDRVEGGFGAAKNGTAFVGEVGINGNVRILNWLYWRAGYNFFWLSGVATPSAQLSATNQPKVPATTLNLAGSALLYGVNTGLEARW